ncbi:hypothetical protein BD324DRAFT_625154 [Kockovaella imperatae]|uniref:Uncharacterized protein n=1 Tax=Kockovaella imperatae TaxID=4999 RepID=A0A1Y1UGK8_9TREE|nr:hypothetical protein BD324DRAFT_625154 [Kockovaella imperatae]ORX37200.1 hypothetical protein BD324DRAFT_625154 [Kockovaella imperatae]
MSGLRVEAPHICIPPFPISPPDVKAPAFSAYRVKGIRTRTLRRGDCTTQICSDYNEQFLIQIEGHAPKESVNQPIPSSKAWDIGDLGGTWAEPPAVGEVEYPQLVPPFRRLVWATEEFQRSRREALSFGRTKRLFEQLRITLGLKTSFPGLHRSGHGEGALPYTYPASVRKTQSNHDETGQMESCVLLAKTESSVRGLLALARRIVEAEWDLAPAIELARMTAAFLAFLLHFKVLEETDYSAPISRALMIAQAAPEELKASKRLEDIVGDPLGWNLLCWMAWGDHYASSERARGESAKGREREIQSSDGGWGLSELSPQDQFTVQPDQARHLLETRFTKLIFHEVKVLSYIPFSRRKVKAIVAPSSPGESDNFRDTHWRVTTVAAPWTDDESWSHQTAHVSEVNQAQLPNQIDFEAEKQRGEEPTEIDIWIDGTDFEYDWTSVIGSGLRGRWALIGDSEQSAWWVFKARDYILPRFWQPINAGPRKM